MTPEQIHDLIAGEETLECLANRPGDRPGWLLMGVYEAPQKKRAVAQSNGRLPVYRPLAPDSGREGGSSRRKKGKGRR